MYYYKIYDLNLTSDLSFPQLMPGNDGSTDVEITSDHVDSLIPPHSSEISYDFSSDVSWLENRTCYLLIQNGNKISYQLKPGGNEIYLFIIPNLPSIYLNFGKQTTCNQPVQEHV